MLGVQTQDAPPTRTREWASLDELLLGLYRQQLSADPEDQHLSEHARPRCVANHVRTFHWYRPFLPAAGKVLDWGCNHAPDSCLLRAWFGERLSLHACDFADPDRHRVFHEFARCAYSRLEDEVRLPYPSNFFDAVIASGALEHAATDYESLKELRRVLKLGGVLVISYLPNWLSVNEWRRRVLWKRDYHRRLYGIGEARQLLKRVGFYPLAGRYHTFFWERLAANVGLGRWQRGLSRFLTCLLPLQVVSSTLCFVARKEAGL
jgi:SAM-dependent methyltransferase